MMMTRLPVSLLCVVSLFCVLTLRGAVEGASSGGGLVCAGMHPGLYQPTSLAAACKPTQSPTHGTRRVIAIFADFPGGQQTDPPSWADGLFDAELEGSLSHFYDTMSFGALQVRGETAPAVYTAAHPASAYLAGSSTASGDYGSFSLEILQRADADIDFTRFDNDGPDGQPDSGDDDGTVDAVFLVLASTPANFLRGAATGVHGLGYNGAWETSDVGVNGEPIRVVPRQGTIQRGRTLAEAVGSMCHEYGHVLGLPDLYDVAYLEQPGSPPQEDSAGIGAWGLMGWGAAGWQGDDGPNSLCAWSRVQLGWATVTEPLAGRTELVLNDVGRDGSVYRVPLGSDEHFLVEYRRRSSTHYDRHLPGEGLLVWHVAHSASRRLILDLECADGRWADAGFPLGNEPAPSTGGDNLDFWAHDGAYASRSVGNLGDATDPFGGTQSNAFTPDTNPQATSRDGEYAVRLEDLRMDGDLARAMVGVASMVVELTDVYAGSYADAPVNTGDVVPVHFTVTNHGGYRLTELEARLTTADPLIEVVAATALKDLGPSITAKARWLSQAEPPSLRTLPGNAAQHRGTAVLEICAQGVVLARQEFAVMAQRAHRLAFRVLDEDGQAIDGIRVQLYGPHNVTFSVTSRTGGSVPIWVPPGEYTIAANDRDPFGTDRVRAYANQILTGVAVTQDDTLTIVLPWRHRVHGVVRDGTGVPVPNASLHASGAGATDMSTASEDGTYELQLPAGLHAVTVSWNDSPRNTSPAFPGFIVDSVLVTGEQRLDLTLPPTVELRLELSDSTGRGVAGAQAYLRFAGMDQSWGSSAAFCTVAARTDAGGVATCRILADVGYDLTLRDLPPSVLQPSVYQSVATISAATDTTVHVVLPSGVSLTVCLTDDTGAAVEARFLHVMPLTGDSPWQAIFQREGVFSVTVAPGPYRLAVDFGNDPLRPAQILGEYEILQATELDLSVESGVEVLCRVIDDEGGAVSAGRLSFYMTDWEGSSYPIGTFFILTIPLDQDLRAVLPAGTYDVRYDHGRDRPDPKLIPPSQALGTVTAAPGTNLTFVLDRGVEIAGRLLDPELPDLSDLRIYAAGLDSACSATMYLAADGLFQSRLLRGTYVLRMYGTSASGSTYWSLGEIDTHHDRFLLLDRPAGAILSGRATDPAGDPVEVELCLTRAAPGSRVFYNSSDPRFVAGTATFSDEAYALPVSPGVYDCVAFARPLSPYTQKFGRLQRNVDLTQSRIQDLVIATPDVTCRITGSVPEPYRTPATQIQFIHTDNDYIGWARCQDDRYVIDLPPGRYETTVSLAHPRGGAYGSIHDLGMVQVTGDMTWDIALPEGITAIASVEPAIPVALALLPNYPNPFNARTTIEFTIPDQEDVRVTLFDVLGRQVRTLVHGVRQPGAHRTIWDGRDDAGYSVGTGVYLCRLTAGTLADVRRVLLLK
jgi:M6 family metalloprotease-like protein